MGGSCGELVLAAGLCAALSACSSAEPGAATSGGAAPPHPTPTPTSTATTPPPEDPSRWSGGVDFGAPASPPRSFALYNTTPCYDELGMAGFGIVEMPFFRQSKFFASGADVGGPPDLGKAAALAEQMKGTKEPMMLDIESWPTIGDDDVVAETVARYESILDTMLAVDPSLTIGFYGVPPVRNYNAPVSGDPTKIANWHANNDKLVSLAEAEGIVFPSVYTFYNEPDDWVTYAIANVEEARRLAPDKAIAAVVWPRYHDDETGFIDQSFFALQLDTLYEHADAVVIWDFAGSTCDAEPWWNATKAFAEQHDFFQ
jgi:hypothetical protein